MPRQQPAGRGHAVFGTRRVEVTALEPDRPTLWIVAAPRAELLSVGDDENKPVRILIALVAAALLVGIVYVSKRRSTALADAGPSDYAPSDAESGAQRVRT